MLNKSVNAVLASREKEIEQHLANNKLKASEVTQLLAEFKSIGLEQHRLKQELYELKGDADAQHLYLEQLRSQFSY